MKTLQFFSLLLCGLFLSPGYAQEMHPEKIKELIVQVADTVQSNGNTLQFLYKERMLICIYDENANRMRIITPIVEREQLNEDQILNALVANYHSALDVKYALSDEIIWSVFTHPLKELYPHQVLDAIDQIWAAANTFGTTYSSTHLVFPGNTKKQQALPSKKIRNKT
ncbi:hypothetical protein [Muriicola sp. Z0-33]|uniref:hypothetical protein n=1 Tax=Muriicola sp. Z0-33 TaxID=2816957 RepID=UPI0022384078|nr:hypothetical protein [Muriicola sp. Z0-33]MCW5517434.1 hypothetical protein [Muriicola sp. Z0-33]